MNLWVSSGLWLLAGIGGGALLWWGFARVSKLWKFPKKELEYHILKAHGPVTIRNGFMIFMAGGLTLDESCRDVDESGFSVALEMECERPYVHWKFRVRRLNIREDGGFSILTTLFSDFKRAEESFHDECLLFDANVARSIYLPSPFPSEEYSEEEYA